MEAGRCRSRIQKFYHDSTTGTCKAFFYSGCQGGQNMFSDQTECEQTCVASQSPR